MSRTQDSLQKNNNKTDPARTRNIISRISGWVLIALSPLPRFYVLKPY
ncbi:hypothetical protein CLOBOL_05000 [Enterocloster bolteae ATCC BAA-613]|uniref:Uncharacterized protein n=1 Tax=Enterocloster bolteae (strain ATCC BAA-613 / DSM 15670 / CCUG 46953 / JCM 12243 / WAL 16351) TaxID=411902 RepID=A8RY09_ENTBW|nr:hypothetical protein CLOBOL_05000 [Enterocloster bolteae ATCC BAA-613]